MSGLNSRLCDSECWCRGLLSCVQRHHISGQRGERPPLHQAAGTDHPEEHPGHEDTARDPGGEREYIK